MNDVWVTRDKTVIPIAQLDDDHLRNIIRFARRHSRKLLGFERVKNVFLYPRVLRMSLGEKLHVVLMWVWSLGGRRPEVLTPSFPNLLAELKRRGLEEKEEHLEWTLSRR